MTTEVWDAYHRWYYDTGVWAKLTFLGVPTLKSISDMWNYQEIITERKPSLVVEFGTSFGGSALYFSMILQRVAPRSRVLTVDPASHMVAAIVRSERHIECMAASSADQQVADRIRQLRAEYPGSIFAILDSDHQAFHVLSEMRLLRAVLTAGDYLVVEDGNINGHPVLPGWGQGPWEGLLAYEAQFPGDYAHDRAREEKFGFTFAANGFLIRQ
jgi:cephalosporin hydroxylase